MSQNEIFDIFDENMQKIGKASRLEAHTQGLWHRTFQCWVIQRSGADSWNVLFQLRHKDKDTFPSLLDISCAGHLLTGEDVKDGMRELKEELGLNAAFEELVPCGVFTEEDFISETCIDREFCHVFIYECSKSLKEYRFQASEITGLFFIDMDEFKQLIRGEKDSVLAEGVVLQDDGSEITGEVRKKFTSADFVPHPKEYYDLLFENIGC